MSISSDFLFLRRFVFELEAGTLQRTTDGEMDRQTDGRTDGQARPALGRIRTAAQQDTKHLKNSFQMFYL